MMTNKDMITIDDKEYAVEELEKEQQIYEYICNIYGISKAERNSIHTLIKEYYQS